MDLWVFFFKINLFQNSLWRKTCWEILQATLWLLILMVGICQSSRLGDQREKRHLSPALDLCLKISWTASWNFNLGLSSQSLQRTLTFGLWFGDVLVVPWRNIKSWVSQLFFWPNTVEIWFFYWACITGRKWKEMTKLQINRLKTNIKAMQIQAGCWTHIFCTG